MKKRGMLIVISGPSGAGKGTICSEIMKNENVYLSISMTSRKPRKGDINGKTYYFVTKEEFEESIKNNELLEYAVVFNGDYYGTPKKIVEKKLDEGFDVILEIDIQGALQIKENYDDGIFVFIMPPSMRILRDRLVKRGTESKEKVVERFKKAYKEMNEVTKYNYVVVNDEIEKAVEKVNAIIISEKCRVDRIEEVDLNNKEELIHELLTNED